MKSLRLLLLPLVLLMTGCPFGGDENPDTDENSAPIISNQEFSVIENARIGTIVGIVTASDADGDDLAFSISSGNIDGAFQINQDSGEIEVASSALLDFEKYPVFSLSVSVTDQELSSSATITINLNNVDEVSNDLSFNGTNYTFIDGLIEDYGNYNPIDDEGDLSTHYNYDFIIIDDEIKITTVEENGESYTEYNAENATISVYAELFSPNANSFQPGTFEFTNLEGITKEDVVGDYFFRYMGLEIDPNSEMEDNYYEAISGIVVVVENSNLNYTITYDVTVKKLDEVTLEYIEGTEQAISFSYTGDFLYHDENESTNARIASVKRKKR
ncbi:Cadherin domain-containing protein [Algoriphagus locisalis]|uniref:Cadherin domain-containing protein n=1 Tax=Algoriphagus locisalis TaxID=305507 RepID=A0A1I7BFZ8_9BACT|nr:cadherin repeat domain-containing protein [Algoriphagus locisalis]SFT86126.1 Cadherin domain-containing protein [Algoriphagus locisalis]